MQFDLMTLAVHRRFAFFRERGDDVLWNHAVAAFVLGDESRPDRLEARSIEVG